MGKEGKITADTVGDYYAFEDLLLHKYFDSSQGSRVTDALSQELVEKKSKKENIKEYFTKKRLIRIIVPIVSCLLILAMIYGGYKLKVHRSNKKLQSAGVEGGQGENASVSEKVLTDKEDALLLIPIEKSESLETGEIGIVGELSKIDKSDALMQQIRKTVDALGTIATEFADTAKEVKFDKTIGYNDKLRLITEAPEVNEMTRELRELYKKTEDKNTLMKTHMNDIKKLQTDYQRQTGSYNPFVSTNKYNPFVNTNKLRNEHAEIKNAALTVVA